jgi:histidinol dehydrogenase
VERLPVLPVVDLRGSDRDPAGVLPRAPAEAVEAARGEVRRLVEDVAARGDAAVAEAARRFDGVDADPAGWRATPEELAAAEAALDPALRAALLDAVERARAFHEAQRPADVAWSQRPGVRLVQRFVPLGRAGVYVPGGRGAYPSSVVMNVVPAQAAGVMRPSSGRRPCSAWTRSGCSAAPRRWPPWPAAPRRCRRSTR